MQFTKRNFSILALLVVLSSIKQFNSQIEQNLAPNQCQPGQRGENIMCPADFTPVCGIDESQNIIQTYSNACSACQYQNVYQYSQGECIQNEVQLKIQEDENGNFYCLENRNQICSFENRTTCGLYFPNSFCILYPCGQQYSNECEACKDPNVEKYFFDLCEQSAVLVIQDPQKSDQYKEKQLQDSSEQQLSFGSDTLNGKREEQIQEITAFSKYQEIQSLITLGFILANIL